MDGMDLPRTLEDVAARFPLTTSVVDVHGRKWRVASVQDQDALLEEVESDEDLENFPYGLLLWASAVGLARRVAREPALVAGKRVLEMGAGVGLSGIVAASAGAVEVVQTDYQPAALALCAHNAAENGVTDGVTRALADWRRFPADLGQPFDVVLGSDVLYERTLHADLLALLPTLVAPGGLLLVSDPQRPQAADFWARFRAEQGDRWTLTTERERVRFEGQDKEIALHFARPRQHA
jgi:predicted nicotinamide N-methyase